MIKHRIDSIRKKRIAELKAEMLDRDYRAIKVIWEKFSDIIEAMYPGETEWHNEMIAKINELEDEA